MKKLLVLSLAIMAVIGLSALLSGCQSNNVGYGADYVNRITVTQYATNTGSGTVPIQVLALDSTRNYALFQNLSDTAIYLFFSSTTLTPQVASATFTVLNGVRLAPVNSAGSVYEMRPENISGAQVWASSTASGKTISVMYR